MDALLPQRKLGKSDLSVSPIGLGCWQFMRGKGLGGMYWTVLTEDEIREIVRVSLEGGINWFDTAEAYGHGESERILAKVLKELDIDPTDVIIATKWLPFLRTARSIIKTIPRRLACLKPFQIDLYQIHNPMSLSSLAAQMNAMAQLVKDQQIRYVGVSNFSAAKMKEAHRLLFDHGLSLIANQVKYSLLDREIEKNGVLETAQELGITIIAYSPLAQGILTGKFHENPSIIRSRPFRRRMRAFRPGGLKKSLPLIEGLKKLARKYEATPAQIALNWVIQARGETVVAIPGATASKQAKENAGALRFELRKDDLDQLESLSAPSK